MAATTTNPTGARPRSSLDRGHDVLCISSIDWDFIWQGHQEIMSTLAAQGHRVLFLENTGVRSPKLRDLPRLRQRIRNWWRGTQGLPRRAAEPVRLFAAGAAAAVLADRAMDQSRADDSVAAALDARRRFQPPDGLDVPADAAGARVDRSSRPVADDLLLHRRPGVELAGGAQDHLERAGDVPPRRSRVRDVGEAAAEGEPGFGQRSTFFRSRCSFQSFEEVRLGPRQAPDDIARLPRPVVGYVGGMHQWVDQDLAADVAAPDARCDVCATSVRRSAMCRGSKPARTSSCLAASRTRCCRITSASSTSASCRTG